jgi:hypothetical protein
MDDEMGTPCSVYGERNAYMILLGKSKENRTKGR